MPIASPQIWQPKMLQILSNILWAAKSFSKSHWFKPLYLGANSFITKRTGERRWEKRKEEREWERKADRKILITNALYTVYCFHFYQFLPNTHLVSSDIQQVNSELEQVLESSSGWNSSFSMCDLCNSSIWGKVFNISNLQFPHLYADCSSIGA